MTSDPLLIYGANGYTGRLIVEAVRARGLRPILGGRNPDRLEEVADAHSLEFRTARLTDSVELTRLLRNVAVVLLAAGPFSETAPAMVDACLAKGIHYLDLTGECGVFETLFRRGEDARRRATMLMPGCGFDVVASDCLVSHVSSRVPAASHLAIGFSGLVTATRGSLRTMAEQAGMPIRIRREGRFASVPPASMRRRFDYGTGDGWSTAVTWGDVATAFYTTGIPNIEVYFEETININAMLMAGRTFGALLQSPLAQTYMKAHAPLFPEGPTATERAVLTCTIVAEASARDGRTATSRLRTPEAYATSAQTAAAIAERATRGDVEHGFQTPARVYGPDFILRFQGVAREDLASPLERTA